MKLRSLLRPVRYCGAFDRVNLHTKPRLTWRGVTMKRYAYLAISILVFLFITPSVNAATFTWEKVTLQAGVGTQTHLQLLLDTQGSITSGADVILSYDPTAIEINTVRFNAPFLYAQNLFAIEESNRLIRITSSHIDTSRQYTGRANYAYVLITPKKTGTTTLSFRCVQGETNETNIVAKSTGDDLLTCADLKNATITVSTAGTSPTPTPTASACTRPDAVTDIDATAGANGTSATLSWTKANGASWYSLEYGTKAGTYTFGASNIGSGASFTVDSLEPKTTYFFAIAGVNDCGTGQSGTASTTTGVVQATPQDTNGNTPGTFGSLVSPTPSPIDVYTPIEPSDTEASEEGWFTVNLANFPLAAIPVIAILIGLGWLYLHKSKKRNPPLEVEPPKGITEEHRE